jgi:uncharacterized protein DUF6431
VVIVFISPSAAENNSETDWATIRAESIPRKCPECSSDSVIGHGRRRKQAHDEDHDWIGIRRGLCTQCWKTITFLPLFSLPYTHYSAGPPLRGGYANQKLRQSERGTTMKGCAAG